MSDSKSKRPALTYEEGRQWINCLIDVSKKTTVYLTLKQLAQSLATVFGINSPNETLAFANSFVDEWRGWLKRAKLPSGEIGYRWA